MRISRCLKVAVLVDVKIIILWVKNISFHIFPKDPIRRNRWIQACKRITSDGSLWQPESKYIYICSEHFVGKKHSRDKLSIDYIPSLFQHNISSDSNKRKIATERYERAHKSSKGTSSTAASHKSAVYPVPGPAAAHTHNNNSTVDLFL